MHEYGLMEDVVVHAIEEARKRDARAIAQVHLKVGELLVADPDALRASFDALSKGTVLEGARLDLTEIPGRFRCPECDFRGSSGDGVEVTPPWICPECTSLLVPVAGRELVLAELTLRTSDC